MHIQLKMKFPGRISIKALISIFIFSLLSGCFVSMSNHGLGVSTSFGNWDWPVTGDSSLAINRLINIKPGNTRVFIQDGIIVSQFNHYQPNCNIEIRKKDDDNWQYIKPAVFQVTSSRQTLEEVVRLEPGHRLQVAYSGNEPDKTAGLLLGVGNVDSSQSDIYHGVDFYLAGNDDNVMRLSCRGALAAPQDALPPSLEEIQQALGDIMHLKL